MNENNFKGDYLTKEGEPIAKTVYLFPDQEEDLSENMDRVVDKAVDEAAKEVDNVKSLTTFVKDEFEGEIIQIYKNNLVVEVDSKDKALIKENEKLNIRITKGKNAYECSLKVLGIKDEGEKLLIVLSIPVIERKVDRRRFFRISLKFMARYCIIPKGDYRTLLDIPSGCFLKTKKTYTNDISGGGISIIADEQCETGTYVLVCLYLPNKIDVLCKVVRSLPNSSGSKNLLSMKYVYINELDRDKVVGFVIKNEVYRRSKNREK